MGFLQSGFVSVRWFACIAVSLALFAMAVASAEAQTQPILPQSQQQIQLSFSPVVKKVTPAVVNIFSSRTIRTQASPLLNDPLFRQFFGRSFGNVFPERERTQSSLGSGVIISDDGLIITSHHVIRGADDVRVVLADRREFDAEIILNDEKSDLALLRINTDGEQLPYLSLKDSDALEVGDLVLAVGNPFGVGQTVTSGIISALARATSVGVADFQFFIQTDAAINPGNSGGALVDMNGELIGVNTAIYSTSGSSSGVGFAIPANMVRSLVASAKSGSKRVIRPWLGVGVQRITGDIAESLGMKTPRGVLLAEIAEESPAAQAGLKVGDVVLAINGYDVNSEQSMHFRAAISPLGEAADFTIWRSGDTRTVNVDMVPPPEQPARDERKLSGAHPLHGVTVWNLSPAVAVEMNMNVLERGVVVSEATASRLFQRGDVILGINGDAVESTGQLEKMLGREMNSWRVRFKRGGQTMSILIR